MNIIEKDNYTIFEISKAEISNIDFVQCREPYQTLESFKNNQSTKPDILINGGFFNMLNGKPVMDYIDNGVQKANDATWNSYGIGVTSNGELKFGNEIDNWKDFITAYPPLIINNQCNTMDIAPEIQSRARRSIIGYNINNIYLIVIDSPGATISEAQQIAANAGCQYAVNLDGGGSTRLLYGDKVYASANYNRPIDNVIAIYLKKIIYRVQLGAFSSKERANTFCYEIQSLGYPYTSAYVRLVGQYYKVQVGAFTIKTNAESMLKDLKSKGYSAFITTM